MYWTRASAYMFIEDKHRKSFEKEFKSLVEKYFQNDIVSSNVEFGKVIEIDDLNKNNKCMYKSGNIYKVKITEPTWLVLFKVTHTLAFGSFVNKKELDLVMSSPNGAYGKILVPNKKYMKISKDGKLLFNNGYKSGSALPVDKWEAIDNFLEYYDSLKPNVIANIERIMG